MSDSVDSDSTLGSDGESGLTSRASWRSPGNLSLTVGPRPTLASAARAADSDSADPSPGYPLTLNGRCGTAVRRDDALT
jgi:hypothetical protein